MKKILYLLTLLMTISFGSYGQQLKQIQKGTDKNQIPVTNGKQNTQVYRDAVPYILDTLHLRDSLAGIKGSGIPTRVAYWAAVDSLGHDPQLVWDTITKGLTVNTFKVWRGANNVGTNLGIGKETLQNATGINNFAIGDNALKSNTTGMYNLAIGKEALKSNTTGMYNLAIGNDALKNATTASNNVGIGDGSLTNATTGYHNVGLGVNTLSSLTTGSLNIGIGGNSLYNATTAHSNIGLGYGALNTTTTGTYNMAIGYSSLNLNQTGRYNVAIGAFSLFKNNSVGFNVAIGSNAGYNNTSGTSNVFIGNEAGYNETGSNTLYIDNSGTSSPLIGGNFSSNRVGINKAISGINTTLHVGGNATIDDISGTATKIAGFDSNNKVVEATVGTGLSITGGTLINTVTQADGSETKINAGTDINVTGDGSSGNPYVINNTYTADGSETKINAGTNISISGTGTTGNPYVINSTGGSGTVTSVAAGNGMNFSTITGSGSVTLGTPSAITLSSTNSVTSTSHTHEFNPGGTAAQYIRGNGTLATFPPIGSGTVTSIATNNGITGGTITTSGTIGLTGQALALHNLGTNGLIARTGSGTVATRTITAGNGIAVSNGDGVSGNPSIASYGMWFDWGSELTNWGMSNTFNSGKKVGLGDQPTRLFDVNGDTRFRGAIYSSSNSPGSAGQVLTSNGSGAWSWQTPTGGATNLSYSIKSGTDVYLESSTGADVIIRDGINTTVNRVASNVIKIDATGGTTYNGVRNSGSDYYVQNYDTGGTAQGNGVKMEGGKGTVVTGTTSTNGGVIKVEAEAAKFGQLYRTSSDYTNSSISGSEFKVDFDASMNNVLTVNTSTDRITIPSTETGEYRITYSLTYKINTSGAYVGGLDFYVKKNGTSIGYRSTNKSRNYINDSDNMVTISRDFIYYLAGSDYIELFAIRNAGTFTSATLMNAVFNVQKITNTVYP